MITPKERFYVRNHFAVPRVHGDSWSLTVGGLVRHHLTLALSDLYRLPSRSLVVTIECAGNGRAMLEPPVGGEQWQLGAVSTAEWTGVPLIEVLDRAGVATGAREVVFRGLDQSRARRQSEPLSFERSLPMEAAQDSDVLLAYAMNGEPLSPNHGFPLRLVVPGWYGMASVKWLAEIAATDRPFSGHFQTERYVIVPASDAAPTPRKKGSADANVTPLTRTRVRSIITTPEHGDVVRRGELLVRGYAWSGEGEIARVEVDTGSGWRVARLLDEPLPYAWRRWELTTRIERPGLVYLRARATDVSGHTQPDQAPWNHLGYANNSIQSVQVDVFD